MSFKFDGKRKIRPTHPGAMLRAEFLPDYGLSAATISRMIGVGRHSVYEILAERRAVSPEMALRLARLFGNTPGFWLDAQRAVDLWDAQNRIEPTLRDIRPLERPRA